MYFSQLFKIKSFLFSICISIILSLLTTFLYTKNIHGKTKVTVLLNESYIYEIDNLISKNYPGVNELFESVRLKYFMNYLKQTDNLKKFFFSEVINSKNFKLECKNNMSINYVEIDKRTFAIEIADKTQDIEAINICISSTVDFINNLLNDHTNEVITKIKSSLTINKSKMVKEENLKKLDEDLTELQNAIKKNPIKLKIGPRLETTISKYTNAKIYFATIFICYLISTIFILERKKIFKFIGK
jgi:hypothetical protein